MFGYYDSKLLEYYPQPREWQFRDEYPVEDVHFNETFGPNEWDSVRTSDSHLSLNEHGVKSPEDFKAEVEQLRQKFKETHTNHSRMFENKH